MTWSYEELDSKLREYGVSASNRGNKLLKVFFGILSVAAIIIALLVMCVIPKSVASTGLVFILIVFVLFAIYVIITAREFHKNNGVFCPHCGKSLISFGNILDNLEDDGIEKPNSLSCSQCHRVVVKDVA